MKIKLSLLLLASVFLAGACAQEKSDPGAESMAVVQDFMGAMGAGDFEKLQSLMHEDMVWKNEGDANVPWIGTHEGKAAILSDYMGPSGKHMKILSMSPSAMFARGDQAAVFGRFEAQMVESGKKASSSFAILIGVDRQAKQIVSWQFFEDSFAVSEAFKK